MTIKIVEDGPDIVLTRSEHRRYMEAYRNFCKFHVSPPSFEEFVRSDPFQARSYTEARAEVARLMG